jgi:hypothetical protein
MNGRPLTVIVRQHYHRVIPPADAEAAQRKNDSRFIGEDRELGSVTGAQLGQVGLNRAN